MRVTGIRTRALAVPLKDAHVTWMGTYAVKSTVLVEVFTDEGIVGLGEAPGVPFPEVVQIVIHEFESLLEGHDPFEVTAFNRRCLGSQSWHRFRSLANYALGGIDMALWDIIGKATGQPLHRLLGGAVRNRIDMFAWIARKTPEEMVADVQRFRDQGFAVLYVKVGLGDERDQADIGVIRQAAGPAMALRVDANGAWTAAQAIRQIRRLEPFQLDWVEQPVGEDDFDGFAMVRNAVGVRLCIDQGAQTNPLAYRAIVRRLADFLCLDIHRMGGILPMKEMASMANQAGIAVCRHAGPEFGISATAHLHVAATIADLTTGNQTYATVITDDIVEESTAAFERGCLPVPDRPGIGVTLNEEKAAHYARLYQTLRAGHHRVMPPAPPAR